MDGERKKCMKKLGLLIVTILLLLMPVTKVQAAEIVESGTCGDNLTWTLDDEGTLVISGTGKIPDYSENSSPFPKTITKLIIENGITKIGDYAFARCSSLAKVKLPKGIVTIGNNAFVGCGNLTEIELKKGIISIVDKVFDDCYKLKKVENFFKKMRQKKGIFKFLSYI